MEFTLNLIALEVINNINVTHQENNILEKMKMALLDQWKDQLALE